jgi:CDGSH-type Zn-finger protein/uncharacterized Fe-S cluster protein YjdI
VHAFEGDALRVTWSRRRCIHAAACVFHQPDVFQPGRRPWIELSGGDAAEITRVVTLCPTGALHTVGADGEPDEALPEQNLVVLTRNGPTYVRGDVEVLDEQGAPRLADTRLAACRCGRSANKPFCDGSHREAGFADAGAIRDPARVTGAPKGQGRLTLRPKPDGPLELEGPFLLASADHHVLLQGSRATLCRCGRSGNKPFCDGSHERPS